MLLFSSAFGLDRDSTINQYITTLLLQEEEEVAGDLGGGLEDSQPLCHADALERVLHIIPLLQNTSELTSSLSAAIFKVGACEHAAVMLLELNTHCVL